MQGPLSIKEKEIDNAHGWKTVIKASQLTSIRLS